MAGGESYFGTDRQGSARRYVAFFWISRIEMREGEEQGRLTPALGWLLLHGLPCVGHKAINHHGFSGHHVFVMIGFGLRRVNKFCSYLPDFPNGSLRFSKDLGWGGGFLNESLRFNRCVS